MEGEIFHGARIVAGLLVLVVGFGFHWVGQLVSLLNWDFATRIGLQEKGMLPEFRVYEHAIAVADVAIGWTYGLAGIGLLIGADWGYRLAWIPGVVLIYHALSFWFWTRNQNRLGKNLVGQPLRIGWALVNAVTGILAVLLAWNALIERTMQMDIFRFIFSVPVVHHHITAILFRAAFHPVNIVFEGDHIFERDTPLRYHFRGYRGFP